MTVIRRIAHSPRLRNWLLRSRAAARLLQWAGGNFLRTYTDTDLRYLRGLYCLEQTRDLPGDIVELGVGPGRFLVFAGTRLARQQSSKRHVGYDTFEGFPHIAAADHEGLRPERVTLARKGNYAFSRKRIETLVQRFRFRHVRLVQGDFKDTLAATAPIAVSFAYIDCDLYEGYKAGLEGLYDRVSPGGIILFDEYERMDEWPGAKRAGDDVFASRPEKPEPLSFGASYFVRRRGSDAPPQ